MRHFAQTQSSFSSHSSYYLSIPFSLVFCFSILASSLLVIGGNDPLGTEPTREFIFTALTFFTGSASLLTIWLSPNLAHIKLASIILLALTVRFISVQAWPLLEDDYFRYLWDGRQTVLTLSPWQYAPTEFFHDESLSAHWHDILSGINNPELPTLYGPVLQYLFALAYLISPGELWPVQLLLLLFDLCIFFILVFMGLSKRYLLVFAVHPLILKETMASAHPDSLMVMFILFALLTWHKRSAFMTGIFLGLATASKVSAIIVFPFFFVCPLLITNATIESKRLNKGFTKRKIYYFIKVLVSGYRWKLTTISGVIISLSLLYFPFKNNGASELTSLQTFGEQWRFNPLIYRLISDFLALPQPRLFAGCLIVVSIAILLYQWVFDTSKTTQLRTYPPVDLALFALLIIAPVVNSWYWLWILPLAIVKQRNWLIAVCCLGVFAYFNSHVFYGEPWFEQFNTTGSFEVPLSITSLQLALIAACFLFNFKTNKHS